MQIRVVSMTMHVHKRATVPSPLLHDLSFYKHAVPQLTVLDNILGAWFYIRARVNPEAGYMNKEAELGSDGLSWTVLASLVLNSRFCAHCLCDFVPHNF